MFHAQGSTFGQLLQADNLEVELPEVAQQFLSHKAARPTEPSPQLVATATNTAEPRHGFAYLFVGFGECANAKLDLFDQWSGEAVPYNKCMAMCTGVTECLGFEFKVADSQTRGDISPGQCVLRFGDGTAPTQSPYPEVLKGFWDGHNGVGPIVQAWDGKMTQREAVFSDRKCYNKTIADDMP